MKEEVRESFRVQCARNERWGTRASFIHPSRMKKHPGHKVQRCRELGCWVLGNDRGNYTSVEVLGQRWSMSLFLGKPRKMLSLAVLLHHAAWYMVCLSAKRNWNGRLPFPQLQGGLGEHLEAPPCSVTLEKNSHLSEQGPVGAEEDSDVVTTQGALTSPEMSGKILTGNQDWGWCTIILGDVRCKGDGDYRWDKSSLSKELYKTQCDR